jgi:integrase
MPYKNRQTPQARRNLKAAHRRWYEKAKALNSEAWQRRKEAIRKRAKKYQQKRAEYQKRMWAEDPQRGLAYGRKSKLKILETRAGRKKPTRCEVCGESRVKIHFDHCHQSGRFRGWICFHCNAALGHVRDNPNRLRKLAAYLERTKLVPPQLTLPGI